MESIKKTKANVPGVAQELNFNDKAIDKLFIKSWPRKDL